MIIIFLGYAELENTFQRSHYMRGKFRICCKSVCEHYAKKASRDDAGSPCAECPLPFCSASSVKQPKINPHKDQGDLETCMIELINFYNRSD